MTDTEERLREHGIMAGWLIEKDAEIARLRKGIQDYLDGNYSHSRSYRPNACPHGLLWYQGDCDQCAEEHFKKLLAITPAERTDVEKTGEGQS